MSQGKYNKNGGSVTGAYRKAEIQATVKERRLIARYQAVCFHCGLTDNLLTIKRADGRDWTVCKVYARAARLVVFAEGE